MHKEQIISPEQVAIAKVFESRLRDVFALMAMFIIFERVLQLGAPNFLKQHFNSDDKQQSESSRSKQLQTSAEDEVLTNLKHQVTKLQEENERLRTQISEESKLKDASTDFSIDLPQNGSPQDQLERIKFQYQTDLENWCAARETLEKKYQKLK